MNTQWVRVLEILQRNERLKDKEHTYHQSWGWPADCNHGRWLTTTSEAAKELNPDHPMFVQHLKKTGKVRLSKCSMSWPKIFKKSNAVILWNNSESVMKSGMYMTTSDIQLCGWPIKLLRHWDKDNMHRILVMVTAGALRPAWSTTALRTPVKPLHLRNVLESRDVPETATTAASIANRKGPILLQQSLATYHTTSASKVE